MNESLELARTEWARAREKAHEARKKYVVKCRLFDESPEVPHPKHKIMRFPLPRDGEEFDATQFYRGMEIGGFEVDVRLHRDIDAQRYDLVVKVDPL